MEPMTQQRHYKNAPITEALIDLRVTPKNDVTLEHLRQIRAGYEDEFPTERKRIEGRFDLQVGEEITPHSEQSQVGYVYTSNDQTCLVQATTSGFTFNRLAPYTNWEQFRDEARFWWERYCSVVGPVSVNRLAVRYINKLKIPLEETELRKYINTYPWVSDDLPQSGIVGYFMQLRIPQPDIRAMLVLSQALEGPSDSESIAIILDIDLYRDEELSCDEEFIWNYFEKLRHRKNLVFESSITDDMRKMLDL
jgi:uncharacterized protein (TIGR04255 family)